MNQKKRMSGLIKSEESCQKRQEKQRELFAKSAKHNPKGFFAYVNERRVVRDSIGPLRNSAGDLKSSNADMSMILNEYFTALVTDEKANDIPELEPHEGVQRWKIFTSSLVVRN
ncbi:hypothetical protein EQH57_0046 [Dictyocoela roeselum]|nr:hypothetical protein EQH57_0046 [Dictyocoela roeselum]